MRNYYSNLIEGYTCIKMKSLSIEQACNLTQPNTYSRKILKIQSTNHKSNWTSGGGTYQGAIPPKISTWDGMNKEIKNREQELKGICPRGNNKVVIILFHVYDKCLFYMLELYWSETSIHVCLINKQKVPSYASLIN